MMRVRAAFTWPIDYLKQKNNDNFIQDADGNRKWYMKYYLVNAVPGSRDSTGCRQLSVRWRTLMTIQSLYADEDKYTGGGQDLVG